MDAEELFLSNTFIDVSDEEASKIDVVEFLVQGTIYPDVIEAGASKTGKAHVMKPQHNISGLPPPIPWPRPGRAYPGRVKKEYVDILRDSDATNGSS